MRSGNREGVTVAVREYHYTVDRDGRIFHDGTEIVDPATLKFFLRAMQRTPDDRWLVVCQNEHNWFHADATPFVVQRLRLTLDDRDRLKAVELGFSGDYREPLDPTSLESNTGQLYCRIKHERWRARFGRVALQQIAPFLVDDAKKPALLLDGIRYEIARAA